MTRQAILMKLFEKVGGETNKTRKTQLENIRDIIKTMPEDYNFEKKQPQLIAFLNNAS